MSNTDKDKPLWVRATWYRPYHLCRQQAGNRWRRDQHDCDLPPTPARQRPDRRRYARPTCHWEPVWDRPGGRRHTGRPAGWFIRERFVAPDRLRARLACRTAAQEFRGAGEVEIVPPTDQARHGARWLWD